MGSMSMFHWLIVLLVVVLVFGTKKLRSLGSDLGGAVKGFKDGMSDAGEDPKLVTQKSERVIDAEVKDKTGANV